MDLKLGQTIRRSYRLEKNSSTLSLNVTPANANVLINKEDYSGKSQIELAPGLYRIEISADGYYPQSENITITRGRTLRKDYVLKQKTGKLNFAVSPAEAKVILKRNGRVVKTWQGANYLKGLPVGTYTIEITAKDYIGQTKNLTINDQQITSLDVSLKKDMGRSFQKSRNKSLVTESGNKKGKNVLDNIIVVPNPYIFPSSAEIAGRQKGAQDDYKIEFRNLPQRCTITIYTPSGRVVAKIKKSNLNNFATWDLLSYKANEIGGMYIYHVDAPGIGKKVGRLIIIK